MTIDQVLERRIVTVLFADLVGFTSLSESLDAEDVATVQDSYFTAVRDTIARYGGVLEKFIGDAAMAVFGAPRARDDDAERAVRASLALVGAVERIGARLGRGELTLAVRVGVNTGEVVSAESGPDRGRVTGDTVNVAARFQAAAAPGDVLIGEGTALAVAEAVELEAQGPIALKGKAAAVAAWRVAGLRPERSREAAMGRLRAPMLGRVAEMAALTEALDRVAASGSAERWVVVAPPGTGKSRLLVELGAALDQAAGGRVAAWKARLRPDVVAPYDAVNQLMAAALASAGVDARDLEAVARWLRHRLMSAGASEARADVVAAEGVASIRPGGHEAPTPARVPAEERGARFDAWCEALDAAAGERTALWIVEDVHWAGGDVLAFLELAGRRHRQAGRLVLATARPSILDIAPSWCAERDPGGERDADGSARLVHLGALSLDDAAGLVRALVGDALPADLADQIAARADGNPLFIEELLRTWVSVGILVEEDGRWHLAVAPDAIPLPSTVQAIYAAQLDDLPPDARLLARRASVAGRRFPSGALASLEVPHAAQGVEALARRAFVSGPLADPIAGPSYAYRHALLRDAGYASLARAERARLHVRMARWLENVAGEEATGVAELIGGHYAAALESVPALAVDVADGLDRDEASRIAAAWFEKGGERVLSHAAHDAARTLFRRALDLTDPADALALARRWERLGDATAFAGDMDEGAAALQQAVDLFRGAMDDPSLASEAQAAARSGYARALAALGLVWNQQLRFSDATALADEGLREVGEADDLETARLLYLRAWSRSLFALQPGIREDLERARSLAHTHGDASLELEASQALYNLVLEQGAIGLDEMLAQDREVIGLARALGNWQRVARIARVDAAMLSEHRPLDSRTLLDEARQVAEAHGLREELAWIDYVDAEAGFVSGEWDGAWEAGLRALDLAERSAYHRAAVRTWFVIVPMARARGRRDVLERASRWFEDHQSLFPSSPYGKLMHGAVAVNFAAARVGPPGSPSYEDVSAVWNESQGLGSVWDAAETLARAWLAEGRTDAVRAWLADMARWHAHPLTSDLGRGTHALIGARLDLALGEREASRSAAASAAVTFRGVPAPWWLAKAQRVLEAAGGADPQGTAEAQAIERSLGVGGGIS